MPFLTAINGQSPGKRYELREGDSKLGRHPDCHVVIEQGAVSRYHAQITVHGNECFIEDLKSRNGTFLNNELIKGRTPLKHGDQVKVCEVAFTFHRDEQTILQPSSALGLDGSSYGTMIVDDEAAVSNSTVMSKLDISSHRGTLHLQASPEVKLRALIEITQSLGKALSLDDVLPQVLSSLFKIFVQADRGFLVLKDAQGNLVLRHQKTRRDEEENIRISRTIINQAMKSKEAILSADAASDSRFEMSQSIADFRIRSMMCVPLLDAEGEAMGVIQIDTLDQRSRFQSEDLEVLASVAAQASIAIVNAQLHDQAVQQKALERDLELAHDMQRGFLPKRRPDIPGYEFYDYYEPANHVGGDYFDYIPLAGGRLAVIVADVVGHGVAAAILMVRLLAEARVSLVTTSTPAEAVIELNNRLCELNIERFVTLLMVVLDPEKNEATIVNAGHMAPIRRRRDGVLDEPGADIAGLPVGIMEGTKYDQVTIDVAPGDVMMMYTDGVNEAMNREGEQYGIDRIRSQVMRPDAAPAVCGEAIIEEVMEFIGDGVQEDDMCLVSIGRL